MNTWSIEINTEEIICKLTCYYNVSCFYYPINRNRVHKDYPIDVHWPFCALANMHVYKIASLHYSECILDFHSVLFIRFQVDLKFWFFTTLNIIFIWPINIYEISKDMGYGWLYGISFRIPGILFSFQLQKFISRELILLYILLWFQVYHNSSC